MVQEAEQFLHESVYLSDSDQNEENYECYMDNIFNRDTWAP